MAKSPGSEALNILKKHIIPELKRAAAASRLNPRCTIEPAALELEIRRYLLSIEHRLTLDPSAWKKHGKAVLKVVAAHGDIAAAIASISNEKVIDEYVLMKAAQVVELECRSFLALQQGLRAGAPTVQGGFCW